MRPTALPLLLALLLVAAPCRGADPAVARPSFPIGGEIKTRGLVFFVASDAPAGAVAIGTAHTFHLTDLVKVKSGELVLGHSRRPVARTTGLLTEPGRPFDLRGGGYADDYLIYRLEAAPTGVRLLELDPEPVRGGARVRLLGVPGGAARDEDRLSGTVRSRTPDRIDIELDLAADLKGWGGAPVIDAETERVVGIVQAGGPRAGTTQVIAAPVTRVGAALASPLDGGRGRPFSSFALHATSPARRAQATPSSTPRQRTGALLEDPLAEGPQLHLDVEYPPDGAVVGDGSCGAFVSGRAIATHGERRQFDVMFVIDTSVSTAGASGADINGNGVVGEPPLGGLGSLFFDGSTDPGDSILAAEVAAARRLLDGLDPRSARVGVIAFAGEAYDRSSVRGPPRPAAVTLQPLTEDFEAVQTALDGILIRKPYGTTHIAAGLDQATRELYGLPGALSHQDRRSERIVFFFTDGQPTLPYGPHAERDNVEAVLRAASRAARASIRVNSFAIGPEALNGPMSTVEMAAITDGFFTPVRHPGDLVDVVEEVSFANLENVWLESRTTGEPAAHFRATADGSWAGFVKLEPGANQIEVRARTSDGLEEKRRFSVTMSEDAEDPPIPTALVLARNRLLEDCLRTLKQVRVQAEEKRAEEVRKALLVEIEEERAAAKERAAAQRKRLRLDVQPGEETP